MRDAVLNYAEANGLAVREQEHAFVVEVPKGEIAFEVTVLKGDDVLEWFIAARDVATGKEVYADYSPHYAINGESHEELVRELEEEVVTFLHALQTADVRVAQEPLFRIFGKCFGTYKRLEFKADEGWRDWAHFNPPSSAQPRVAGRHRA